MARSTWEFQIYQQPRRMQIAHEARLIKPARGPQLAIFFSTLRVARAPLNETFACTVRDSQLRFHSTRISTSMLLEKEYIQDR